MLSNCFLAREQPLWPSIFTQVKDIFAVHFSLRRKAHCSRSLSELTITTVVRKFFLFALLICTSSKQRRIRVTCCRELWSGSVWKAWLRAVTEVKRFVSKAQILGEMRWRLWGISVHLKGLRCASSNARVTCREEGGALGKGIQLTFGSPRRIYSALLEKKEEKKEDDELLIVAQNLCDIGILRQVVFHRNFLSLSWVNKGGWSRWNCW